VCVAFELKPASGATVTERPFPHAQAVRAFAREHGLRTCGKGTAAFEEAMRTMSLGQYQLMAVHSGPEVKRVLLFPKAILLAERDGRATATRLAVKPEK
jgi:hypothetical protein